MIEEKVAGYILESKSWNGSFWQKCPDRNFKTLADAEKAADLDCKLGLKCNLVTLVYGFSNPS